MDSMFSLFHCQWLGDMQKTLEELDRGGRAGWSSPTIPSPLPYNWVVAGHMAALLETPFPSCLRVYVSMFMSPSALRWDANGGDGLTSESVPQHSPSSQEPSMQMRMDP